jgi:hypothetical protein
MDTMAVRSLCFARRRTAGGLLLLALLYTLFNSVKPLHLDDTAYSYYAAQIVKQPLDPYGFEVFWYDRPEPANDVLAPLALPYWLALGLRLFGERMFLIKLWLLPFSFLFTISLYALFRRFAGRFELMLVAFTLFSPTFLPSLNLMLDVPALALALASVALLCAACERRSLLLPSPTQLNPSPPIQDLWRGRGVRGEGAEASLTPPFHPPPLSSAISPGQRTKGLRAGERGESERPPRWRYGSAPLAALAGLVAGVGMETKYTALLAPATMVLYAVLVRRVRLGLLAAMTAVLLFVGCELVLALYQGESHFLHHLQENPATLKDKLRLTLPLLMLLGGSVPALGLLALAALRVSSRTVALVGAAFVAGLLLLALVPACSTNFSWQVGDLQGRLRVVDGILGAFGVVVLVSLFAVARRLCRGLHPSRLAHKLARYPVEWFLVLWLLLEIGGFFALSPFPAVRRIMGVTVVATLLCGRLAARTLRSPAGVRQLHAVTLFGILLGLMFFGVDFLEAQAEQFGAEGAAHLLIGRREGRVWYVGHWGFQFYAEKAGMIPVIPEESRLQPGDWLVIPDSPIARQRMDLNTAPIQLVYTVEVRDPIPLRTFPCYYSGRMPLEHLEGPRVRVRLYRITADFTPDLEPLPPRRPVRLFRPYGWARDGLGQKPLHGCLLLAPDERRRHNE